MLSDMVLMGFYGAELADVQFGDIVLVIGVGPVGLMSVAGANLKGASRIFAVGTREVCREAAAFYGATELINYKVNFYLYKVSNSGSPSFITTVFS